MYILLIQSQRSNSNLEEYFTHLNHAGEVSEVEDVVWPGGGGEEVGDSTIVDLQGTGQNDLQ